MQDLLSTIIIIAKDAESQELHTERVKSYFSSEEYEMDISIYK